MAKIFKADFLKMAKMQIGPFGSEPSTYGTKSATLASWMSCICKSLLLHILNCSYLELNVYKIGEFFFF